MKKRNEKSLYHAPTEKYEPLMERLEDYDLGRIVKERQSEKAQAIEVELDDL
jgi:antitoxin StbD